jgi:hypothetical protein
MMSSICTNELGQPCSSSNGVAFGSRLFACTKWMRVPSIDAR